MSLKLKLKGCVSGDCDVLTVTENTGLYNANSNVYGWDIDGTVNIDKSKITSAVLEVKGPGQTTFSSVTVTTTVQLSSSYVEEFTLAVLAPSDIGMTTFENGQYDFIYTVMDNGNEYIRKTSKVFLCPAKCCYNTALKTFLKNYCPDCDCCDGVDDLKDFMVMSFIIEAAENTDCLTSAQLTTLTNLMDRFCEGDSCC